MSAITLILVKQVLIMFILAAVGYLLFKSKKISLEGSKNLGNILIFVSLPCVIVNGFLVERTTERIIGFFLSALAAIVVLAVCILISRLFFNKDAIANFASTFSNPGFFGIPLIVASLSSGAVFYIAAFIAFLNLGQWTYGVSLITGKKGSLKASSVLKAPFFIAIVIGLAIFLSGITLPEIVTKSISTLAGLNTPIAMFTIGIYMAQVDIVKMIKKSKLYLVSAVRLILIPLVVMALLWLVPSSWNELKIALLIAAACPVGSNVAVYAQLHNSDYPYAVETVVISTLLSIITIPAIVQLAGMIW